MKEMKFKPELLKKHLNSDKNVNSQRYIIFTVRDEEKGKYGDLFHIEGCDNPFVLMSLTTCYDLIDLAMYCKDHHGQCGFETADEMLKTVLDIYPNAKRFYVHMLGEVFP